MRVERDTDLEEKPHARRGDEDAVSDEASTWFLTLREAGRDDAVREDFARWLDLDKRHGEAFGAVEALWNSPAFGQAAVLPSSPTSLPVRPVSSAPGRVPKPRPTRGARLHRLAQAACLVLAVTGAGAMFGPGLVLRWEADVRTMTGERRTVALPDGSMMTLNTASAASLDFEEGRRSVRLLSGEAFFDVRHDPARPFRVTSRFGEVEVLGTAFDVRMDGEADEIALERGHVRVVSRTAGRESAELRPGEALTAGRDALSPVHEADLAALLGWRDGRIAFAESRLSDILAELGRYREGPVVVIGSQAGRTVLSGSFRLDDVESAIGMLADTAGLSTSRLPGGLLILH